MKLTVTELKMTCSGFPSQWEGRTTCGKYIYVRYRWGGLRAGVGITIKDAVRDRNSFDWESEDMGGIMDTETMMKHLAHLGLQV